MILSLALNTLDMALDGLDLDPRAQRFILLVDLSASLDSGRDKSLWRTMVQAADHRRVCLEICQPIISDSCCLAKAVQKTAGYSSET